MRTSDKISLVTHALRWRLTWNRADLDHLPAEGNGYKFITARRAAALIPDNANVFSSGLAGNGRCTIFYRAIRDRFLKEAHPANLTWMHCGAQGGRGKVPGTIDELAIPGLIGKYIAGHVETSKQLLGLAEQGKLGICILSQGVMSRLLDEQAAGRNCLTTTVGVQTFLDPRTGRGSALTPGTHCPYVEVAGDSLTYTMPKVDVALFSASYADAEGNIYFHHSTILSESLQSAAAARANGGMVMVSVGAIIPKDEARIVLRAKDVDHIVVDRFHEQAASIPLSRFWPMFTVGNHEDPIRSGERLRWLNDLLKITPVRNEVGRALARSGASLFTRVIGKGDMVNIGSGYPEEIARVLVEQGLGKDLLFTTEAGTYGGLPAPGIFFSAAIGPIRLEPSSMMFRRYIDELDVSVLGMLQFDESGNVNVSRRGASVTRYGGPGGLPDIAEYAKTLIFVGKWMDKADLRIRNGRMHVVKPGTCKYMKLVDEVTFSGQHALASGKEVYYVTNVGTFKLTARGMELIEVMPGIRIKKDILDRTPALIVLKEGGPDIAHRSILKGRGFALTLAPGARDADAPVTRITLRTNARPLGQAPAS